MRLLRKVRTVITLSLVPALLSPCLAQSGKTAIIHMEEFFRPERGIERLVRALKELDPDFYSRPLEVQEKQFFEIEKVCFPEGEQKVEGRERVKEVVCPVFEDISNELEAFAKRRRIEHLVDIHDEAKLFKVDKLKDRTREFVKEYNRRNP